jgi:hypothetical protein
MYKLKLLIDGVLVNVKSSNDRKYLEVIGREHATQYGYNYEILPSMTFYCQVYAR